MWRLATLLPIILCVICSPGCSVGVSGRFRGVIRWCTLVLPVLVGISPTLWCIWLVRRRRLLVWLWVLCWVVRGALPIGCSWWRPAYPLIDQLLSMLNLLRIAPNDENFLYRVWRGCPGQFHMGARLLVDLTNGLSTLANDQATLVGGHSVLNLVHVIPTGPTTTTTTTHARTSWWPKPSIKAPSTSTSSTSHVLLVSSQDTLDELANERGSMVHLIRAASEQTDTVWSIVILWLLELDTGTSLLLDALDHIALLANHHTNCLLGHQDFLRSPARASSTRTTSRRPKIGRAHV